MNEIYTYNDFLDKLKSLNLSLSDLSQYGCLSKTGLRNFKKHFSKLKDSKPEWNEFKKDDLGYYSIVIMNPDIALKNKRKENMTNNEDFNA